MHTISKAYELVEWEMYSYAKTPYCVWKCNALGLIVTWSDLVVTWKDRPHMGINSWFPHGLCWFANVGCILGSFLQLSFPKTLVSKIRFSRETHLKLWINLCKPTSMAHPLEYDNLEDQFFHSPSPIFEHVNLSLKKT